jgi:hypothetical protein
LDRSPREIILKFAAEPNDTLKRTGGGESTGYSYRSASIGSNREALTAGTMPARQNLFAKS